MKECIRCWTLKPETEFSNDKSRKDGLSDWCKSCRSKDKKDYYKTEHGKEVQRKAITKYYQNEKGKTAHAKHSKEYKQTEKGKLAQIKANRLRNQIYPKIKQAMASLNNEISAGRIVRPLNCDVCGKSDCKIEGHHYDYSKPLDVIWVCKTCHIRIHKELNN